MNNEYTYGRMREREDTASPHMSLKPIFMNFYFFCVFFLFCHIVSSKLKIYLLIPSLLLNILHLIHSIYSTG